MEAIGKFDGSSNVSNGVTNGANSVHNTINKAADAARPAVDRVAESAHLAVDRLASVAASAAETLSVRGAQIRDAQAKATTQARGYISAHPLATVGIAVGVGFLLSRLLSSTSSR